MPSILISKVLMDISSIPAATLMPVFYCWAGSRQKSPWIRYSFCWCEW